MIISPYQIFCVGVIWFIYTLQTFFKFIFYKITGLIHFFHLTFISFIYNSEKDYFSYINKSKKINYPKNCGIVLNKFLIKEDAILSGISRFIRWVIFTNHIQYLTIYDAFGLLNNNKLIQELTKIIENNEDDYYGNVKIYISYKDTKTKTLREKIIKNNSEKNLKEYSLYISIIGFKDANENLINKIIKQEKPKIYGNYPDVYKWFDNKNDSNNLVVNKEYQKYLTRKNEISLPELIITFGKNKYLFYEDICLYGFPFTLLENSEIINVNHKQFDQIDIIDFVDIFKKNSKITKRFGK